MKDIDKYRPGNLVIFENNSLNARIAKVMQVEYVDNKITSLQIDNGHWISKQEIRPASLFVDCLLNLKFYINSSYKYDSNGNIRKIDYEEEIYHYYNGELELLIHKHDNTIWYKNIHIHYIHQLQNLCTEITGEPLLISDLYKNSLSKFYFENRTI